MMKSLKGVLGVALLTAAGAVAGADDAQSAATASAFRPGWYAAPMFSYLMADSGRCTDDGMGGLLAFGNRGDFASLEIWGQYQTMPYDCTYTVPDPDDASMRITVNEVGDTKLTGGGLGLVVGPFFEQRILARFFGIVGFGVNRRQNHPKYSQDDSTIFGDAGIGYMHPFQLFGMDVNARTEVRYRYDVQQPPHPTDPDPPPEHAYQDILFNLGLQIPLSSESGPVPEPPPVAVVAVADDDNDGVNNDRDQCPGTPPDSLVNNSGCTPEAVPAPAPEPARPPPAPVSLDNAKAGDTIVLSGVTFEFNRAVLQSNARTILDGVAKQLIARPDLKIEVGGHTDAKGSESYNQALSQQRAQSVMEHLTEQGVGAERLSAVGYGEAQPVGSNDTDEGRERNRRVELQILEAAPVPANDQQTEQTNETN